MHHHLSLRSKLIIMASVMASLFLVALDQTIISTALGKIVEDFNAYSSLSWVVTAYLITTTITTPIAGKLSDMFGRRTVLLVGVTIFSLGSLLSGMAGDVNQLILFRALQGIGGGIITANAFTIVGDLFAARERGRWQGLIGSVFGIASFIGPLLGGFLTESHQVMNFVTDWRWTFFINIPVGIIAFAIIAIFCPPLKHENKPSVDYVGAGLLAIALAPLVRAVDWHEPRNVAGDYGCDSCSVDCRIHRGRTSCQRADSQARLLPEQELPRTDYRRDFRWRSHAWFNLVSYSVQPAGVRCVT
jgi:MFS family permease